MSARSRSPYPTAPDLPPTFEPSPVALATEDVWDGVGADDAVEVPAAVADVRLRETVWTRADLVGRSVSGASLQDVRFLGCDLSGSSWEGARLERVEFVGCRMQGAVFAGAVWHDVAASDCRADGLDLRMAEVTRTAMTGGTWRESDFYGARLDRVRFTTDLTGANFDRSESDALELHGSTLDAVRAPAALAGAAIDADQVFPLGAALVASLGFRVR